MPQSDGDYQCSQRVFSCVGISIPGRDRVRNIKLFPNLDWTETALLNDKKKTEYIMIYFKLYFGESTLFYFCYSIFFDKKDLREMF